MSEVKFLTTVDETRTIRLPDDAPTGRVEVVVRKEKIVGNGAAILEAIRNMPPRTEEDEAFWKEAREELYRDRDAWDER